MIITVLQPEDRPVVVHVYNGTLMPLDAPASFTRLTGVRES